MKRLCLIGILLAFLTGCASPSDLAPSDASEKAPEAALSGILFRVGEQALLTGEQGLYCLPETDLASGSMIDVSYDGTILETYPAQFATLYEVAAVGDEYNRIGLYQRVIEELMATDEGLNHGITQLVFDFTNAAHLTQPEINAILYWATCEYDITASEGTYPDLLSSGSVSEEEFPYFEDGLLIQLEVFADTGDGFGFHISKWRSALGAYFFHDCTAKTSAGAPYEYTYQIGSHIIS